MTVRRVAGCELAVRQATESNPRCGQGVNTTQKLEYLRGKLHLIPAFGDSIGREVNKAELGLCTKLASQAIDEYGAVLTDAAMLERTLADLAQAVKAHNGRQTHLGDCIITECGAALTLLDNLARRRDAAQQVS